ncbi:MAG: 3-methyl-2-oxobutanoate hydroxymethyltransferase [Akkermansiaceae bacterium]|jgi:3-methyl-2-oxobutanoate hydroxymethyltransferase|tara:strand:- start:3144 stop:3908 length:765 start_codon:yes stop_codon:yes gene_type:complete
MNLIEKADRLRKRKNRVPISALTAYDYPTARLLDEAGVDLLLVGDSLGMVVFGYPDTTRVTLDHMTHHTEAVARGAKSALILGDLPINTYPDPQTAVANARKLVEAGAQAVKLEGGLRQAEKVRAIIDAGIPVIGHLGMLPQRVKEEGGYKKKGKTHDETQTILEGALALQDAGVFAIVLESVLPKASRLLTRELEVPTIGIGCGEGNCDGEIAVITDVIGSYPWFVPPFATQRADVAGEITKAVKGYLDALSG